MIGETNYCAKVITQQEFALIDETMLVFCYKHLSDLTPEERRSKVIGLIIRATVQTEILGFPFQKIKNTRAVVLGTKVVIHFYLLDDNLFVAMSHGRRHGAYTCEETLFADILHNVIQDTSRPLYTSTKSFRDEFTRDIYQETFKELESPFHFVDPEPGMITISCVMSTDPEFNEPASPDFIFTM